jgi:hypothetical protein
MKKPPQPPGQQVTIGSAPNPWPISVDGSAPLPVAKRLSQVRALSCVSRNQIVRAVITVHHADDVGLEQRIAVAVRLVILVMRDAGIEAVGERAHRIRIAPYDALAESRYRSENSHRGRNPDDPGEHVLPPTGTK